MDDGLVIETRELSKRYDERIVAVDNLIAACASARSTASSAQTAPARRQPCGCCSGLARPDLGTRARLGAAPGSPASLARVGSADRVADLLPLPVREGQPARTRPLLWHCRGADRCGPRVGRPRHARRRPASGRTRKVKQRLGIAGALLKDPEFLILDEPTNGLDPAGMAEMRSFIRNLGQGRRTVLLSSHLMTEVEQVSDRVGVIPAAKSCRGNGGRAARTREPAVRAEPLAEAELARRRSGKSSRSRVSTAASASRPTRPPHRRSTGRWWRPGSQLPSFAPSATRSRRSSSSSPREGDES